MPRFARSCAVLVAAVFAAFPPFAAGDTLRLRFAPAPPDGRLLSVAIGPGGTVGELTTGVGGTPKPFPGPWTANRLVTFRHPYSGKDVVVPMKLPDNTPRVEHIGDRVRLNYGSYYVEARFLPDGAVDVVYNSGFLRPLPR